VKNKSVTDKGISFTTSKLLDEPKLRKLTFYSEFHFQNAKSAKSNVLTNQAVVESYQKFEPNLFEDIKPNKSERFVTSLIRFTNTREDFIRNLQRHL
jgi:hypothetical protein